MSRWRRRRRPGSADGRPAALRAAGRPARAAFRAATSARWRKRAMQVGHLEPVGQHEIAVEAHERAQVEQQRRDPGAGGEDEGRAAQRPIGQKAPGEGGKDGEDELSRHAGETDRKPLAARGELPGLRHVGVEHRPQHQEREAHAGHAAAITLGGQRVAELVHHLHDRKRQREVDHALDGEEVAGRVDEGVPAAGDEVERQRGQRDHQLAEYRAEQPGDARVEAVEPAIGAEQGDAQEEIVLQQPHHPVLLVEGSFLEKVAGSRGRPAGQQAVHRQEFRHVLHLIRIDLQRRLAVQARHEARGVAGVPARQDLELAPAQPVELVARRVMQRPGRRAVERRRAGMQRNLLAQRRQRARPAGDLEFHHQRPVICRSVASGRRIRK